MQYVLEVGLVAIIAKWDVPYVVLDESCHRMSRQMRDARVRLVLETNPHETSCDWMLPSR